VLLVGSCFDVALENEAHVDGRCIAVGSGAGALYLAARVDEVKRARRLRPGLTIDVILPNGRLRKSVECLETRIIGIAERPHSAQLVELARRWRIPYCVFG